MRKITTLIISVLVLSIGMNLNAQKKYSNKKILVFIARIIYWLAWQLNMVIMQTSNELAKPIKSVPP